MEEIEFEQNNLQFGTAKKKALLLTKTGINPVKLTNAVKKFGEPMPSLLSGAEDYAADFFDFLLEADPDFYGQYQEGDLMLDVTAYVKGEIWSVKHASRSVIDGQCAYALDLRKVLKDGLCAWAQTVGHLIKHNPEALKIMDKDALRTMLIEAGEEAAEIAFEQPLKKMKLLN